MIRMKLQMSIFIQIIINQHLRRSPKQCTAMPYNTIKNSASIHWGNLDDKTREQEMFQSFRSGVNAGLFDNWSSPGG